MADKKRGNDNSYQEPEYIERCGDKVSCARKVMLLFLALTLLTVLVLTVLLVQAQHTIDVLKKKDQVAQGVCFSKECVEVAARVSSAIDFNVDPCDNFYDFACGTWVKRHVVPDDRSNLYTYGVVRDDVQMVIKYLLEGTEEKEVEAVRKARDYYQACMNETHIETLNTSVICDLLEEMGGHPTLETRHGGNWKAETYDLTEDLVTAKLYGISHVLNIKVELDSKNTSRHIIHIFGPKPGLENVAYYKESEYSGIRAAYKQFKTNVAVFLGADRKKASADMERDFLLEKKLAEISMPNEEQRKYGENYNKMTVYELEQNFAIPAFNNSNLSFNWTVFLQRIIDLAQENVIIGQDEEVLVLDPEYCSNIFNILASTDPRTVRLYFINKMVSSLIPKLPKRFRNELAIFDKVMVGVNRQKPRWKDCSSDTLDHFGLPVGRLFVKEAFDEESKSKALEMIDVIKDAFLLRLSELRWMDMSTRKSAEEKARYIKNKIGYDRFILDDIELNKYYEEMVVGMNEYLRSYINFIQLYSRNTLMGLRTAHNKETARKSRKKGTTTYMLPAEVNAYYSPSSNFIYFPAGILQPPYYSKHQPRSMNYGGIGWLIGHEITHAFDDQGRKYDKNGNLGDWWSAGDNERFNKSTQCFINQYNAYQVPDMALNINGEYTLGENIADNGGLKQSFKAYTMWEQKSGKTEPPLPGLNYSHRQLFFINFAQGWCGVATKEYWTHQIYTKKHSPGRFRVIGSLQNSEEFANTFNCPFGSYMNPKQKCHLW